MNQGSFFNRSGDLIRWNANLDLVFVGRKDFQLKINGQRLDAGEVENTVVKFNNSSLM